jgi:S-adenosyl-L-methionine hydrolase (adenosine-forming)
MSRSLVTLLTDFGSDSPYVAEMKGVLLTLNPNIQCIDLTHSIPPQDVAMAARTLADIVPSFPPGTTHVVVVDPGVGTERRLVGIQLREQSFFGPDNGVFEGILRWGLAEQQVELSNPAYWREAVSATFHGRDILAPVAAHWTLGIPFEQLGKPCFDLKRLDWPVVQVTERTIRGECLWVDRFGNIISSITADMLRAWDGESWEVRLGGEVVRRHVTTYGEEAPGELVALFGSQDRLEIAQVRGSAAQTLQFGPGMPIVVTRRQ